MRSAVVKGMVSCEWATIGGKIREEKATFEKRAGNGVVRDHACISGRLEPGETSRSNCELDPEGGTLALGDRAKMTRYDYASMKPTKRRLVGGVALTTLVSLSLPFSGFIYLVSGVLQYLAVGVLGSKRRVRTLGRDNSLPVEIAIAVMDVPIITTGVSLLSSLGFFLLSRELHSRMSVSDVLHSYGALSLLGSLALGGAGLWSIWTTLVGHLTGRGVLPFQPGVNRGRAIVRLKEWRTGWTPAMFPGRAAGSACWADQAGPGLEGVVRVREAPKVLFGDVANRWHGAILAVGVIAWCALFVTKPFGSAHGTALATAGWCVEVCASALLVVWSAVLSTVITYYDHLRWKRRIEYLSTSPDLAVVNGVGDAQLATVVDRIDRLSELLRSAIVVRSDDECGGK